MSRFSSRAENHKWWAIGVTVGVTVGVPVGVPVGVIFMEFYQWRRMGVCFCFSECLYRSAPSLTLVLSQT